MALISASLALLSLFVFLIEQLCLGSWVLRKLRLEFESFPEHFLISVCGGVILTEIAIFLVQWTQHIRTGSFLVVLLSCLPVWAELRNLWRRGKVYVQGCVPFSQAERIVLWSIGVVLLMELLASFAPLTGSDALHYHFATERLILEQGFHPIFFVTQSFLCGQNHLLILLGLALGSESLAMGLIFLGGTLGALSVACLTARLVPRLYAMGFALLFLLTPLVFWQISSSGSPDVWMAAFAGAAVLIISTVGGKTAPRHAVLAGFFAGGVAGAKYTGCVIAMALAIEFLAECRSAVKGFLFLLGAFFAGVWPFARNLIWTGDPVFPLLVSRLFPERANPYALGALLTDTGAASSHSLLQVIPFLLFAKSRSGGSAGFWEFCGPIVLALAPLAAIACRNTREWRARLIVWFLAGVAIFFVSGMTRFMLPLLPIAFSCIAAGVDYAGQKGWVKIHGLSIGSVAFACVVGAGGLAIYSAPAILAAVGVEDRQHYLERKAPEYQICEAVNASLGSAPIAGNTLVFFRHVYYLQVPYIVGDPYAGWEVNPAVIKTAGDWRVFLHSQNIAYVVRARSYPSVIAAPLEQLEKERILMPYAKTEVQDFQGMRVAGKREPVSVLIFRVAPLDAALVESDK